MKLFVTGGAGFIGSQFIRDWVKHFPQDHIINYDKLTYAGNLANLAAIESHPGYSFVQGDILDSPRLLEAIPHGVDAVVHFAAESHVDRSLHSAAEFVRTNVLGTQILLDAARHRQTGRFLHISTDEVGGSMRPDEWLKEDSPLQPRSPYAASKTAAEHLVRAAGASFGTDYVITRTSNNYGPFQLPEKLLPLAICNALDNQPIPVYGDGLQVRDWIHVQDNSRALMAALCRGRAGQTYHIGGGFPRPNRYVLEIILNLLDRPNSLLVPTQDRPGHDRRYAVNFDKIARELNWQPQISFVDGLHQTIHWYQDNQPWVKAVRSGEYLSYYQEQYGRSLLQTNVA
jgi:dTDP-glucose 4,6-dehydratase